MPAMKKHPPVEDRGVLGCSNPIQGLDLSQFDPNSGIAGTPDREEEADVGTADGTVSVQVFGASRAGNAPYTAVQ